MEPDMELVGEAADGVEALSLVEQADPDVLLLDLSMPRLDGLSVLARLRENGRRPRIVVYSGYADPASARAAHELGAADCLVKGVPTAVLIESLRAAGGATGPSGGRSLLATADVGGDPHRTARTRLRSSTGALEERGRSARASR
jgi:DNA-binding NarL/FixJ family response regulator